MSCPPLSEVKQISFQIIVQAEGYDSQAKLVQISNDGHSEGRATLPWFWIKKISFSFSATRLDFDLMPHTDLPEENLMREYEDMMSQGLYEVTREITIFCLLIAIKFYF